MKLHFYEPPAAQKIGGLDAAIRGLQAALERAGHSVKVNTELPADATGVVVHFHGMWQRNYAAIARECTARDIPFIVSPHGMLEPWAWRHKRWKKLPYWHLIEKRWTRRAACVLATAEPEAARLARFFPHTRIEPLALGMTGDARPDTAAARAQLGYAEDETVLLYLSRIHEKKGLDLLLHALADLHGSVPPRTRLVIVGPEEQPAFAAQCRDFAQRNAARLPRIEWLGAVWSDARWRYFQSADLFCLPTHSENFGLAVLEACQVGTPALTTTETPWATTLAEGRGFIARPDRESVRAQLALFFQTPRSVGKRAALAEWAWANFHWDALAARYAALYASLAARV